MTNKLVTVTGKNIKGELKNVKAICNLSSVPHSMLSEFISNIPWMPTTINIVTLYTSMLLTKDKKMKRIKTKRKNEMVFIVDGDDKNFHHKIKNLCKINNWNINGTIKIEKCNSHKINKVTKGLRIRVCNHHHSKDAMRLMSAMPYMKKNIGSLIGVDLVITHDDRVGSVGGLTYILKRHNIPYSIEKMVMHYDESWISTHKKYSLTDVKVIGIAEDLLPEEDKFWQYKTGCAETLITDKGRVRIKINDKHTTDSGIETDILSKIITKIKRLYNYLVAIINSIKQLMNTWLFTKQQNQEKDIK